MTSACHRANITRRPDHGTAGGQTRPPSLSGSLLVVMAPGVTAHPLLTFLLTPSSWLPIMRAMFSRPPVTRGSPSAPSPHLRADRALRGDPGLPTTALPSAEAALWGLGTCPLQGALTPRLPRICQEERACKAELRADTSSFSTSREQLPWLPAAAQDRVSQRAVRQPIALGRAAPRLLNQLAYREETQQRDLWLS